MKVSPTADYPVRVLRQEWEEVPSTAHLYAGIFAVALNYVVDVSFVPNVSSVAPPWDHRVLPANLDEITTAAQARFATALLSSYVVTPNEALAGTDDSFRWELDGGPETRGVVLYVTSADFDRYAADLDSLTEVVGSFYSDKRVSELRDHEVVEFLERRVVASPLLAERDAVLLGQAR